MMRNISVYVCGLLVVFSVIILSRSLSSAVNKDYGEQIGTVHLPVSCDEEARSYLERGLALLHHMTYEDSRAAFASAIEEDPDCFMGYWGQAMTFIHPLWSDPPSEEEFKKGQALLNKAKALGQKTPKERAYIDAVEAYYAEGKSSNEKVNLSSFEKGWEEVYRQFPEDLEAASFYALAHMATADPTDKTYTKQKRAAAIAEKVLAQEPNHPGGHHYIIHAYDYPELAERALSVARSYGNIAPEIPHALHMPTHIFTRLGYWQESITMNKRSAASALKHPVDGAISLHYPHALDYLVYAYLQQGDDQKANQVQDTLKALEGPFQVHIAASYPFAAIPARLALERQEWVGAASLEPRIPSNYPWDRFPAMEAITYFAKALGSARSGDVKESAKALETLEKLREQAKKSSSYWAQQVEIQRLSAMAWLKYQEGEREGALNAMKKAAKMAALTEKHPITPGEVLPARELLADMLLDLGRYKEAQTEYEASLDRSPNRFNSLYGAGRAAELGGDKNKAAYYYKKLVEMTANDTEREQVRHVKAFLADN